MTRIDIMSPDGRRAAAFLAILGGCMVNTLYIFCVTLMLRAVPEYLLYLALCTNVILLVSHTALGWAMGRRLLASASRDGVTLDDKGADE